MSLVLDGDGDITGLVVGALPANVIGAGAVRQVVNATYSTQTTNATSTFADTGLSASITPTSSTSKILVLVDQAGLYKNSAGNQSAVDIRLLRDSTSILSFVSAAGYTNSTAQNYVGNSGCCYLDSPATTSSVTYKTQFRNGDPSSLVGVQANSCSSTITLLEIAA